MFPAIATANDIPQSSIGAGIDARAIREGQVSGTRSYAYEVRPNELEKQAQGLALKASALNWDGEGSLPVQPSTLETVRCFLGFTSLSFVPADMFVSSYGHIVLEYYKSSNRRALLTFLPNGDIVYTGVADGERFKSTGTVADTMPGRLLHTVLSKINASA